MNKEFARKDIISLLLDIQSLMNAGVDRLSALQIVSTDISRSHPMELIGLAHLALCTRDRRHLVCAVRCFIEADCTERLPDLYSIAIRFGDIRSIVELQRHYADEDRDLKAWICEYALPRFDCYEDGPGVFHILVEDGVFLSSVLEAQSISWSDAIIHARSACKGIPEIRFALLEKIAAGEVPVIHQLPSDRMIQKRFADYAAAHGITILRHMHSDRSQVFLAIDEDGIVKIFKEISLSFDYDMYGRMDDTEIALNEVLNGVSGIAPYYGVLDIGDEIRFLRFGVAYGSTLATFISGRAVGNTFVRDAGVIIGRLAETVQGMHVRGIAHLDIRPENSTVDGRLVCLLDFGDSRRVLSDSNLVSTHMQDARYVSPEVVNLAKGGCPTDIFQLGILLHQLMKGTHPFAVDMTDVIDRPEVQDLGYALVNTLLPYRMGVQGSNDAQEIFLSRMLSKNPAERPTAKDVVNFFQERKGYFITIPKRDMEADSLGTVIFPARMGVPHRGHIDYLSRILDLGYSLLVSLQRSYFHDENNPLPKWIVLKMIAKSLQRRGHDLERVRFMCTPLFMTQQRLRMHFSMMSDVDQITAVATGNPDVPKLFPGIPVIDQRTVFGKEGETYEDRSWGTMLRESIRTRNFPVYRDLIAEGAEEILGFEEIRAFCLQPPAPQFIWEDALVQVVLHEEGRAYRKHRVLAYETPEDTVARMLGSVRWIDRFSRDSILQHDGHIHRLFFDRVDLDESNNQCIHYILT